VRLTVPAIVIAAVTAGLTARGAAAPGDETAQRALRERHVVVTALDRADRPVTVLSPADLTVREDDIAREVLRVEPATDPMHIALLVDTSAATENATIDLRKGLETFAQTIHAKSPDTMMALISFGERPTLEVDYTTSVPALQRGVGHLFPRSGAGAYLLEAIIDATKGLKKRQTLRPIIVAFSSEAGPEFSPQTSRQVSDALKDAGAELWVIVLETHGARDLSSEEARNRALVLGDVTAASGGARDAILSVTSLQTTYAELAARLTSQLLVTYARPESLIPPERLEITVKRDGLRILAPRWTGQ
jgi:von Willebrand factor type A domain